MEIACHQILLGHSKKRGYGEAIVSKQTASLNSPASFDFQYAESRRNIGNGDNNDRRNCVMEIEPLDNEFRYQAAICTQWITVGTPSIYTHILIPQDGATCSAADLLHRSCFMDGEKAELALKSTLLTVEKVEAWPRERKPRWAMNTQQKVYMGNFLSMYWMTLTQNLPTKGRAGAQLPVLVRSENMDSILDADGAIDFFEQEIISRLPREAEGMVSAAFAVRPGETGNFKKAVCVFLSTDKGAKNVVDFRRADGDILKGIPKRDRDAMEIIGGYLMDGEESFPRSYLRLRTLKDGIPKRTAPYILYFCHQLEHIPATLNLQGRIQFMENGMMMLKNALLAGNTPQRETLDALRPFLQELSVMWENHERMDVGFYREKLSWLKNEAGLQDEELLPFVTGMQNRILDVLSAGTPSQDKLALLFEMLTVYDVAKAENTETGLRMESYLADSFLLWLSSDYHPYQTIPGCEKSRDQRFTRILSQWARENMHSIQGKQSITVKNRLFEVLRYYPERDENQIQESIRQIDKTWLLYQRENLRKNEKVTSENIRKLVEAVANLKGVQGELEDVVEDVLNYVEVNFGVWAREDVPYVKDDTRFLELMMRWLKNASWEEKIEEGENCRRIEQHIIEALNQYGISRIQQDQVLGEYRKHRAEREIREIAGNDRLSAAQQAQEIAGVHNGLYQDEVELSEQDRFSVFACEQMLPRMMAWGETPEPFSFKNGDQTEYEADWLLVLADRWSRETVRKYTLQELDTLEETLQKMEKVLLDNGIRKDEVDDALRKAWIKYGDLSVMRIENAPYSSQEKAYRLAALHRRLKQTDPGILEEENLTETMTMAMAEVYMDWGITGIPFVSGFEDEDRQKPLYDDDWFVSMTKTWIETKLEGTRFVDELVPNKLYLNMTDVLGKYVRNPAAIREMLHPLQMVKEHLKLQRLISEKNGMQGETADRVRVAVQIADIHRNLVSGSGKWEDSMFLDELTESLLNRFVDWSMAQPPFSTGNGHYEDNWFIEVAQEWVRSRLPAESLSSGQIMGIRGKIEEVCKKYRSQNNALSEELTMAYLRCRVKELQKNPDDAEKEVGILAGIACGLEDSPLRESVICILADNYVAWSAMTPPFGLSYEKSQSIVQQMSTLSGQYEALLKETTAVWIQGPMNQIEDALKLSQIEERLKKKRSMIPLEMMERIQGWKIQCQIRDIEEKEPLDEKDILTVAGIRAQCRKMGLTISFDEQLEELLIQNFVLWGSGERKFATGDKHPSYEDDRFLQILQKWEQARLPNLFLEKAALVQIRESAEKVCRIYHCSAEEINRLLVPLDGEIFYREFEEIMGIDKPSPEQVVRIAEIRKWYLDQGDAWTERVHGLSNFLQEHFLTWSNAQMPFSSGKSGYLDRTVLSLMTDWMKNQLPGSDYRLDEIRKLRSGIDAALRKLQADREEPDLRTGLDILDQTECRSFLRNFEEDLTPEKMRQAAEWYQVIFWQNVRQKERTTEELLQHLRHLLSEHLDLWYKTEKPFACGKGTHQSRIDMLMSSAIVWLDGQIRSPTLPVDEAEKLVKALEHELAFTDERDEKQLIHDKILLLRANTKLKSLEDQEAGGEDIVELAGFYFGIRENDRQSMFVRKSIGERIVASFDTWGKAGFRFSAFQNPDGEAAGIFEHIAHQWMTGYLWSCGWTQEQIREIREDIEAANRRYYHLPEDSLNVLLDEINKYQLDMIMNLPENSIDEKVVFQVIELYTRMSHSRNMGTDLEKRVVDFLTEHFEFWRDERFSIQNRRAGYPRSLLMQVISRWTNRCLSGRMEVSLFTIRETEADVRRMLQEEGVSGKEMLEVVTELRQLWMEIAIRQGSERGASVFVSEIAGENVRARVESIDLGDQLETKLRRFFTDHFLDWMQEDFLTEYDGRKVIYEDFPRVAEDWIRQKGYEQASTDQMEQALELLGRILCRDFGLTQEEYDDMVLPMFSEYAALMTDEACRYPSGENLTAVNRMYVRNPARCASKVFDMYLYLARNGIVKDQFGELMEILPSVWEKTDSGSLRQAMFSFLEGVDQYVETSYQIVNLRSAMRRILEMEHYDLDTYSGPKDKWMALRDNCIEEDIHHVLQKIDTAAILWNSLYRQKYQLTWDQIVLGQTFVYDLSRTISDQMNNAWAAGEERIWMERMAYVIEYHRDSLFGEKIRESLEHNLTRIYTEKSRDTGNHDRLSEWEKQLQPLNLDIPEVGRICRAIDYRRKVTELVGNWDSKRAVELLNSEIPSFTAGFQIPQVTEDRHGDSWLFLSLLSWIPCTEGGDYWKEILKELGVPDLKELDRKDMSEIGRSNLIDELRFCYRQVCRIGAPRWLLDDMKKMLKREMPVMWAETHGGFMGTGMWRLSRNARGEDSREFFAWLKDESK